VLLLYFLIIFFNDFFETNCRTIHQTDFYESLRDGKTLVAVDDDLKLFFSDPSWDAAMTTNFLLTESTPPSFVALYLRN